MKLFCEIKSDIIRAGSEFAEWWPHLKPWFNMALGILFLSVTLLPAAVYYGSVAVKRLVCGQKLRNNRGMLQ